MSYIIYYITVFAWILMILSLVCIGINFDRVRRARRRREYLPDTSYREIDRALQYIYVCMCALVMSATWVFSVNPP